MNFKDTKATMAELMSELAAAESRAAEFTSALLLEQEAIQDIRSRYDALRATLHQQVCRLIDENDEIAPVSSAPLARTK